VPVPTTQIIPVSDPCLVLESPPIIGIPIAPRRSPLILISKYQQIAPQAAVVSTSTISLMFTVVPTVLVYLHVSELVVFVFQPLLV
jgi:hypothetical protein